MLDTRTLSVDDTRAAAFTKAIEATASEVMAPHVVSDVLVERRCEYDGDVVYNVDVILATSTERFNVHRAERLIAKYFAIVAKYEPGSMPVVSFIDQSEMKEGDTDFR